MSEIDESQPINKSSLPSKLRILTVGDGDFSCSLALMRAYPSLVQHLVATSLLLSRDEVVATYPRASAVINDLNSFDNVEIKYGVDATKLHKNDDLRSDEFDLVMFHHPHLGYDNVNEKNRDKSDLSKRHEFLLVNYILSASEILKSNNLANTIALNRVLPCIHLCICASSIENWNMLRIINNEGLQFAWNSPKAASSPPFLFYEQLIEAQSGTQSIKISPPIYTNVSIEKRIRECQHAKRKGHWLGRFGYHHQASFPKNTEFVNPGISNSFHIFLTTKGHNT